LADVILLLMFKMFLTTTELLTKDLNLDEMLQDAVNRYGFTVTEDELKRQLEAELHTTQERQKRIVASISEGIIEPSEAKDTMQDLRDKIGRIERRLDNLGGKVKAREDYLRAIEAIREVDIEQFLWEVMETDPAVFRQILGLIFEPNSIKVKTYRVKGRQFGCDVIDFKFTEAFGDLQSVRDVLMSPQNTTG
jgi:hypothetical protein